MLFTIIQVFVIQLILPVFFIVTLWREKYHSKYEWILQMLTSVMIVVWVFLSGRWDWVGYYLRYLLLFLLIVAVYLSWKKIRNLPNCFKFKKGKKLNIVINGFLLIIFGIYNIFVMTSYTTQDNPIELSFPLKNGSYYIGHGGSHSQMNYHHAYEPQQYAIDIVALNLIGVRANGIYPKELSKYEIYGHPLYSPCNGRVLDTRNNLADLTPPETNSDQPEGNFVSLSCENSDAVVFIAHMQQNSIDISEGDMIQEGQHLGLVGNSGNTSEPHVHIHAEKDGVGVPIHFDEEFLTRNRLVKN